MDDGCSPTVGILIFAGFVILDFVVFGFIAAMQNLNEAAIERLAGEEDRGARLLRRYTDKNERYTHVCELVVLIVHMLLGFLEVPLWRAYFLPEDAGSVMSVLVDVIIFVILILIVLVFGIYTPQKVASRKPEAWALRLAGPVHVVELLFYPIIFLTDGLSNLLARVFGVDPLSDTDDVTEEEIISMVNEGHEQGVLLASEAEMIHNIFEFGDKEAKDIMTHRKNICALDGTRTFRQALEFIKENNYSRFPVFLDDIDNIIGVLHIKEALELSLDAAVYDTPVSKIKGLIREVDFIPETRNINSLFAMMQAAKSHLVIVVDEYGQTAGIVTMEDILEELVGEIWDEHDEVEEDFEKLGENLYRVDCSVSLEDFMEFFDVELKSDSVSVGGWVMEQLNKVPVKGESFTTKHLEITVSELDAHRVSSITVKQLDESPANCAST